MIAPPDILFESSDLQSVRVFQAGAEKVTVGVRRPDGTAVVVGLDSYQRLTVPSTYEFVIRAVGRAVSISPPPPPPPPPGNPTLDFSDPVNSQYVGPIVF